MTLNLTIPKTECNLAPRITVIGVGGAGGNAVNNMIQSSVEGVDFLIANTDAQALGLSLSERRIQIGRNITQGLGAGSRPDIGRAAAEEQLDEILAELDGANMCFVTAGMGGGTGTGAAPVIARAAREAGILTVGVVTKPFHFEGVHRMRMAEAGITEMTQYVDTLIIIPNQNLFRVANEKTTFADAFKMADDVLRSGVRGVTDLMVMPGLINLDFADIRSVMTEMGKAMMGTGEAEGEGRSLAAAEAAISNPLLDEVSMKGARGVLINVSGGMDLTLFEVDEAANRIRDEVDPEANIIFGAIFDQSLDGRMRVSVVATGIDADVAHAPQPVSLSLVSDRGEQRRAVLAPAHADGAALAREIEATAETAAADEVVAVAQPVHQAEPQPAPAMRAAGNRLFAYSQAAALHEPEVEEPAPAAERRGHLDAEAAPAAEAFIAPRPVEAEPGTAATSDADPFAAAAVSNSARAQAVERPSLGFDRKKAQRLFSNLTGSAARALASASQPEEPRDRPRAEPKLAERSAERPQRPVEPAGRAAPPAQSQPNLTGLDSAGRSGGPRNEEDFLDIPAFLRRQAN